MNKLEIQYFCMERTDLSDRKSVQILLSQSDSMADQPEQTEC